jgi:hypothetical protein
MGASEADERPSHHRLSVAEILRVGAPRYVKRFEKQAVPQVQSTLAKLSLCRTAALGGRRYQCGNCDHTSILYNSCGDRHCPTCSGAKRASWLDSTRELILDGVSHYQVVFTLPSELSRLALGNRRAIYNLLFAAAWSSLKGTLKAEHGFDPAAVMVLHTWNQKLDAHAHVHAVVPGGGPSLDGDGWRWAQRGSDRSSVGRYLVDADELRRVYREAFLKGLERLHGGGKLKLKGEFAYLQDHDAWESFLEALRGTTWVSYIEPPPEGDLRPDNVLKYLARYLTGGPISNRRIVSADTSEVTFLAREGVTPGGEAQQVPITISTVEFTRRWSLHILPKGFTKTRRYGGWSNTRRSAYVERCSHLLDASNAPLSPEAEAFGPFEPLDEDSEVPAQSHPPCQRCGAAMIPQGIQEHPTKLSWRHVMASRHRPWWYLPPPAAPSLVSNPPKRLQSKPKQ